MAQTRDHLLLEKLERLHEQLKDEKREVVALQRALVDAHADGYRAGFNTAVVFALVVIITTVAAFGLPVLVDWVASLEVFK